MKQLHLDYFERSSIESGLNNGKSFKQIARELGRDCTTISKEVKKNSIYVCKGTYGRVFNNCIHRKECNLTNAVCPSCQFIKEKKCALCKHNCRKYCSNFEEEKCPKLNIAPYVCNSCPNKNVCPLSKRFYVASKAQKDYENRLSESRQGVYITEEQIHFLNRLLVPLIVEQGQSIHHVYINHKDEIMLSERTLYKLIDSGILAVKNIDLPRKVRYRNRKKKSTHKVDKNCLEGRRYEDYVTFINEHPDVGVVQIDSVEGKKGESCLLTVHFTVSSTMIAIKREQNNSKSVIDFFNKIYEDLGRETFMKLFPVILTDNGSEFSNPKAIEFDENGERRTYVFYCHSASPHEKGACEVNHELIRRIVPKGVSWNKYNQKDINLMMSHVNSYAREKLNDKPPIFVFNSLFGKEITKYFGLTCIEPDDIILNQRLMSNK